MSIMDFELFLDEMDNDYDVVKMILDEFSSSLNIQLAQMNTLLQNGDYTVLSREAHSIKGGARNVMAPRIEECAMKLELSAKNHDDKSIKADIKHIEKEVHLFMSFISDKMPMPLVGTLT